MSCAAPSSTASTASSEVYPLLRCSAHLAEEIHTKISADKLTDTEQVIHSDDGWQQLRKAIPPQERPAWTPAFDRGDIVLLLHGAGAISQIQQVHPTADSEPLPRVVVTWKVINSLPPDHAHIVWVRGLQGTVLFRGHEGHVCGSIADQPDIDAPWTSEEELTAGRLVIPNARALPVKMSGAREATPVPW